MIPAFYKRPWIIIAVCALITVFFGMQLPKLKIENSSRDFLPKAGESYLRFNQCEDEFGSMELIGISLESQIESILKPEYLTCISRITKRVEQVDFVEKVDSLTNIDYVCQEDGSLVATNLIDEELFQEDQEGLPYFKGTQEDIFLIRQKLIAWEDMYDRVILSDDNRAAQMSVIVSETKSEDGSEVSNAEKNRILHEIQNIVNEEAEKAELKPTVYGDTVVSDQAKVFVVHDLIYLVPLVVIVVMLCIFFSFKTVDGTLLPLLTVLLSTIWSCGLMALLGFRFTIISSIIPVALIAVGSAYGIHVLTHYYIAIINNDKPMTVELHCSIVYAGVKDVLVAVLLAGLTTIVGFISLITSPLEPLHSFAIFASFGVLLSLIFSITLVPSILMLKPMSKVGKKSKHMEDVIAKAKLKAKLRAEKIRNRYGLTKSTDQETSTYYKFFNFYAGTKARLFVTVSCILVFSYAGVRKLNVDTAMINYFPPESDLRQDVDYVNKRFAGTNSVYIVVEADVPKSNEDSVTETTTEDLGNFDELGSFDDFGDLGDFSNSFEEEVSTNKGPRHDMTNIKILKAMEGLEKALQYEFEDVGKIVSFNTFLKRMNQVMNGPESHSDKELTKTLNSNLSVKKFLDMFDSAYAIAGGKGATVEDIVKVLMKTVNYDGMDYYEIPDNPSKYPVASEEELNDLVSQYIMLLGGDSLERFAYPQGSFTPTKLRIQVQLRTNSSKEVGSIIKFSKEYVRKHFPEGYKVSYTGTSEMESTMTGMVISSQFTSLIFSLFSVFLIISLSFKSPLAGLLGAIPLALTICLNYMVMGYFHIKLDLITSIIASVAIGVGIDYTIHFLETFRSERALSNDVTLVIKRTLRKSGAGIITNALSVGLGFLVLCFSQFVVLRCIGILIAIVMFTSSSLAMTIIPGVLALEDPKFMHPKGGVIEETKPSTDSDKE